MRRFRRYVGARLHRALFVWFGITIVVATAVVVFTMHLTNTSRGSWPDLEKIKTFGAERFGHVWHDESERGLLADQFAEAFDVQLILRDPAGSELSAHGPSCKGPSVSLPIREGTQLLGNVEVCKNFNERGGHGLLAIFVAGFILWLATGFIAHRLGRPLHELSRVTREIGAGKLESRVRLRRHQPNEVGALAESINDMAARIERQMNDQRALLAAVSHEIRTPLGHIRVLLEMARERGEVSADLNKLEAEVLEIDALIDKLLASSRLDFSAIERRALNLQDLANRARERAQCSDCEVAIESNGEECLGDPTLLLRAIENLLDNAKKHGGKPERLEIRVEPREWVFSVVDSGPGFDPSALASAFDAFRSGPERRGDSLGLGLALVRRIAMAHGGRAWAENRDEGGAVVSFSVSRKA